MTREYDRVLDSKKGMKAMHTEVRRLISQASYLLDNKEFDSLESVYFQIESLMSSLGESAAILEERRIEERELAFDAFTEAFLAREKAREALSATA
jgi:hypothetical protein